MERSRLKAAKQILFCPDCNANKSHRDKGKGGKEERKPAL